MRPSVERRWKNKHTPPDELLGNRAAMFVHRGKSMAPSATLRVTDF